jgi:hypothetical protein
MVGIVARLRVVADRGENQLRAPVQKPKYRTVLVSSGHA